MAIKLERKKNANYKKEKEEEEEKPWLQTKIYTWFQMTFDIGLLGAITISSEHTHTHNKTKLGGGLLSLFLFSS